MKQYRMFYNLTAITILIASFWLINKVSTSKTDSSQKKTQHILQQINLNTVHIFLKEHDNNKRLTNINVPVLLHFSASWCSLCKKEVPFLQTLSQQYGSNNLQVIKLASEDSVYDDLLTQAHTHIDIPLFWDQKGIITKKYGVTAVPQTLLFDKKGVRRLHIKGALDLRKIKLIDNHIKSILENTPLAHKTINTTQSSTLINAHKIPKKPIRFFNLTAQDGNNFSTQILKDKIWVANFIFTTCDSMCPKLTKKMRHIQKIYIGEQQLHLVSFSVNPQKDTPKMLSIYADKFRADTLQWSFLTGKWASIQSIIANDFMLSAPNEPMFHTDKFVLIDRGLKIHSYYTATSSDDMARLRNNIAELLSKRPSLG